MSTFDYVRTYYQVPARRGRKVIADGRPGVITAADGAHIRVRLDGEQHARPWHPTWHMKYLGADGQVIWYQRCATGAPCGTGSACKTAFQPTVLIPDAGSYDDEDARNGDTDTYDKRKVKVRCPGCGQEWAPLCSPLTVEKDSGWRWVGCDHREPYATFQTRHGGSCGVMFAFTVRTPQ